MVQWPMVPGSGSQTMGAAELLDRVPMPGLMGYFARFRSINYYPLWVMGKSRWKNWKTINSSPAELVVIGTPIDLRRVMSLENRR